ncbi:uncharacterized protein LOC129988164 isoform X2 [Argiope bruennichi]|uniref:uncharacterized protein LOC129988164 isoform X2 n=1 Tax=Argiope bruennichi TaxID=94029 RepID=UPI00249403E0|nr:uncharacterized protein LOC129988164 isoform X2 [Argiope bruennichi]
MQKAIALCMLCCWWSCNIAGIHAEGIIKKQNGKLLNRSLEPLLPVPSLPNHRLVPQRVLEESNVEQNFPHEIRRRSLSETPNQENFILQEKHLRYLMSSTAEQPDNSSQSSTFNIWLTILIAALAAAIFS